MGTPAGVAALQPGDHFHALLGDIAECRGRILPVPV
jgi:2-keto-4-pentenoate hydratase/2-oxohepta-3-ene-1,7-dioic acid hydratase in catechol pathway